MSLATFSRELKVFSVEDEYSCPVTSPVAAANTPSHGRITWSGDGKWLAVAPHDRGTGPLPIFNYANNRLQPMKYVTLSNVSAASFFNWTNRNMAVGNENGEIFVWDVKEKKIAVKVEYVENQSVDLIAVNSDDNYIASGSLTSNKICLHGMKTNKVINTFCLPKSKQTSSLKFCMCKKNYLAASSIESTICIWDIMRSDYIFKKVQAHLGACTDISFSPINFDVIASVSLTKTLKMYDIKEGKAVLDVNIGEPMNCCDIIFNGDKVALGTTGGSVIIYDLRACRILHSFNAHTGPVLSVKMQNLKIAKAYKEVEMTTPDVVDNPSKTLDLSVMDVFSPITRNSNNQTNNAIRDVSNCLLSQSKVLPVHSTPNLAVSHLTESPSLYDDSFLRKVCSPQQRSSHVLSACQISPFPPPTGAKTSPAGNHLFPIREMVPGEEVHVKQEMTEDSPVGGGSGDGFHTDNPTERNLYYSDIVSEIKNCQRTILDEVSAVRREVTEMKAEVGKKLKDLREECDDLRRLLTDEVKQQIYAGNCNAKIEQSCLRILMNELNESVLTCEDKIRAEIKLNALRLMHIYEAIKGSK